MLLKNIRLFRLLILFYIIKILMSERFAETLLKRMNIKSVYYYKSNHVEAGRVDDKFMSQWTKFVAGHNDRQLVVNNQWLEDMLPSVRKQLYINFTLFNDAEDNMFTLIYKEDEVIDVKTLITHIMEDQNTFVNMEKIHIILLKCLAYPFPHVVIDDFIDSDKLPKILAEVNKLRDVDGHAQTSPYEFNKYAFNSNYGAYLGQLFTELNSPGFIKHIERITGVNNIICNELSLYGTGIHRIKSKGFVQLHTDFNTYHSKNRRLDRRVNLLIYLNPDWKPEYKGQLCLCDINTNTCAKKIDPILNRCVIFNTTSASIYGMPEPLNMPDDVVGQQYIAVNYYTQGDANTDVDFEGCVPRGTTWYPNIDVSARPTQIFYE
jgi:Rps23 Pro-64 3,4-dihydroxylase Tpa1-like proline 4-hydroxylase